MSGLRLEQTLPTPISFAVSLLMIDSSSIIIIFIYFVGEI